MFKAKEEDKEKIKTLLSILPESSYDIYITYGFLEIAKYDTDPEVRKCYYDIYGWDVDAKKDPDDYNRCIAYRIFGFDDENDILPDESDDDILMMYNIKYATKDINYELLNVPVINRKLYLSNKTQEDLENEGVNIERYIIKNYYFNLEKYETIFKLYKSENLNDVLFKMKDTRKDLKNIIKIKLYDHLIDRNSNG